MSNKLIIEKRKENKQVVEFCEKFVSSFSLPKYLFGRNVYANDIVKQIQVDGFIDDYCAEETYLNIPIVRLDEIPKNSLVLVLSGGSIKSAMRRVASFDIEHLDYFSFYKNSGLKLRDIIFNENFQQEFQENSSKFEWIYNLLNDDLSRKQFMGLLNFKLSYDIDFLKDFNYLEDKQYFEDFLELEMKGEVFVDIGGYDGYTSEEFIKKSPQYETVYLFEPDNKNLLKAKERLKDYSNVFFYNIGLSNKKETLRFDLGGSGSKISKDGLIEIQVDKLDDCIEKKVTFIKMDIEGAESKAIEGAKNTIMKYHPTMAISVYHKIEDFWSIPKQILDIRDDYKIYLRHYTESIYETVMFFIPIKKD